MDYIKFYSSLDYDLLDIKYDNRSLVSLLNNEISEKQNEIYKRIKKYDK